LVTLAPTPPAPSPSLPLPPPRTPTPITAVAVLDAIGKLITDLIAERGAVALQYASVQGDLGLRESMCDVMSLGH
ncbi:MAG: hypothetical protein M3O70_22715, partial [Actinomycetota bacterium]|nr:hypothetical protein [Actinomycetota bacterium]